MKTMRIEVRYLVDVNGLHDANRDFSKEAPRHLHLAFDAPTNAAKSTTLMANARSAPVRPYPTRSADVAAVAALSARLVQHANAQGVRLQDSDVRLPIIVMANLVWQAIHQRPLRIGRKRQVFRSDALDLTLDAMNLGVHRLTAERILRRDHPQHLPIEISALDSVHVEVGWNARLGILAVDEHGRLRMSSTNDPPRILHSLTESEPF